MNIMITEELVYVSFELRNYNLGDLLIGILSSV